MKKINNEIRIIAPAKLNLNLNVKILGVVSFWLSSDKVYQFHQCPVVLVTTPRNLGYD